MNRQPKETGSRQPAPPVLTPPREEAPHGKPNPLIVVAVLSGLILLVLLSAVVIWLLPAKITHQPRQSPPVEGMQQQTALPGPVQPLPHQQDAERLLGEWLQRLARAEAENLAAWGGQEYAEILQTAHQADRMFRNSDFQDAQALYQKAVEAFDVLLSAKDDKLDRALQEGRLALGNYDIDTARKAFEQALAIEPGNLAAGQGMEKAHTLDQALSLYRAGLQLEKQNDLEQAQNTLQEAVRIDNTFVPAAEALERIETRLQDMRYREAMSSALAALDDEDLGAAEKAVTRALQLQPDAPAARNAAERLQEKRIAARLRRLQQQSAASAAAEKWADALAIYQQALKIDPAAGFAVIGQAEAEKRYQLDRAITGVLAKPERLQDKAPLDEARQILVRAESIDHAGPVLQSQISSLKKLIAEAATPVEVTLRSDNATEVEIYQVGIFSPFYEKRLVLRPGKYIIVGRRPGFRDVRMTIEVQPDDAPPLFVFIRCEEPL